MDSDDQLERCRNLIHKKVEIQNNTLHSENTDQNTHKQPKPLQKTDSKFKEEYKFIIRKPYSYKNQGSLKIKYPEKRKNRSVQTPEQKVDRNEQNRKMPLIINQDMIDKKLINQLQNKQRKKKNQQKPTIQQLQNLGQQNQPNEQQQINYLQLIKDKIQVQEQKKVEKCNAQINVQSKCQTKGLAQSKRIMVDQHCQLKKSDIKKKKLLYKQYKYIKESLKNIEQCLKDISDVRCNKNLVQSFQQIERRVVNDQ